MPAIDQGRAFGPRRAGLAGHCWSSSAICRSSTADDVRNLVRRDAPVVIAPDRHGAGTNALLLRLRGLRPTIRSRSGFVRRRQLRPARRRGAPARPRRRGVADAGHRLRPRHARRTLQRSSAQRSPNEADMIGTRHIARVYSGDPPADVPGGRRMSDHAGGGRDPAASGSTASPRSARATISPGLIGDAIERSGHGLHRGRHPRRDPQDRQQGRGPARRSAHGVEPSALATATWPSASARTRARSRSCCARARRIVRMDRGRDHRRDAPRVRLRQRRRRRLERRAGDGLPAAGRSGRLGGASARRALRAIRVAESTPGVIVSDSFGRPWRNGIVNVAIGVAGLAPLADYRGQHRRRRLRAARLGPGRRRRAGGGGRAGDEQAGRPAGRPDPRLRAAGRPPNRAPGATWSWTRRGICSDRRETESRA